MILRCALCHHTGLDVESRIVADESPLGYHREPRCIDGAACEERVAEKHCYYGGCVATWRHWHGFLPGGYDNPDDPEGVPIIFQGPDPEPGALRDENGAVLRAAKRETT